MTVCVAALAERAQAIVLIADKALTYGDGYSPGMQGDTGIKKMLRIGKSGWMAMFSGSASTCDRIVRRISDEVDAKPDIAKSPTDFAACAESVYNATYEELAIENILRPKLLTKELWAARKSTLLPLHDTLIETVSDELSRYHIDASLLLCGFDAKRKANIIAVRHPGIASNETNSGFAAIGSGAQMAIGRLLWQKANRNEHLEVVLYEAYDAKAHAEEIQGVGYACDIRILVGGHIVSPKRGIQSLIDGVFETATMTPFGKRGRMPRAWQQKLQDFRKTVMRKQGKRRLTKKRRA